jgi:two-component system phosphate regulon sensor histidine kinase PhoR
MTPENVAHFMDGVPMPLVLIGADERVIAGNKAAEELFSRRAMLGRHYITVLRQPAVLDCVETALRSGKPAEAQFPTRNATRDITFHVRARPVRTPQVQGVLVSFTDISDLQDATQMRRDFVANVSHELRSPLTALLGFIETLRGPARNDTAAQDRFLGIMEKEAGRMSRLIQDLLSLSRVEAEARVQPTTRVDLASLVTSASMTLGPLAAERGVTMEITGAEDPLEGKGDADQLLQVLTNLMENAIKYGGGHVSVTLTEVERDPGLRRPALCIEVRNNGDGIEAMHIPRLTERFYRVDSHRSREMGGTGLGLAIVKHIVNRHRGRMRIESAPGQGTRFVISLPRD